ncbi:FlgD immunoglobulin-like domain containing protein [Streptomyces sp. NPDC055796]
MKRSRMFGIAAICLVLATASPGAAAVGVSGGEATIPSVPSISLPDRLLDAAGTGLQMRLDASRFSYWRSLKDGREIDNPQCGTIVTLTQRLGDMEACTRQNQSQMQEPLTIHDFASGSVEVLAAQPNRTWLAAVSATQVLTAENRADGKVALHLLGRGNEPRKDVPVATSEHINGDVRVTEADARGALIEYRSATGVGLGMVDFATATMRALPVPAGANENTFFASGLGDQWAAVSTGREDVTLIPRTGTAGTRTISAPGSHSELHQVGDWLITDTRGQLPLENQMLAFPLSGGAPRTVLPALARGFVTGSDGSLYAIGGPDRRHWGIHRVSLNPQGVPVTEQLEPLPSKPVTRYRPTLANGDLTVRQTDNQAESIQRYRASVSGPVALSATPAWNCGIYHDPLCSDWFNEVPATGDGRLVAVNPYYGSSTCLGAECESDVLIQETGPGGTRRQFSLTSPGTGPLRRAAIKAVSGRYLLVTAEATVGGASVRVAVDIDSGKVLDNVKLTADGAAALWGSVLWQPEGGSGVIAATDLRTGQVVQRIDLKTGCRPYELQAAGDWLYSVCGSNGSTSNAAYHVPTGRSIPLPFTEDRSEAKLGDGYVVRRTPDGLTVYNLRSGTARLEQSVLASTWWNLWTVDRFGGGFVYIDREEGDSIHLVGVTGNAGPLKVVDQSIPATVTPKKPTDGHTRWWLSKPASSWKLTIRSTASGVTSVVRSGGEARGLIDILWDGTDRSGKRLYAGTYEWTLTAVPADGQGAALKSTGTLRLANSIPVGRPSAPHSR